jgi:hypothetical protein
MITSKHTRFGDSIVDVNKIKFIELKIIELYNIPFAIAEVGVYKGGTAKIIFDKMKKEHDLYLFDTFEGIPNKSEHDNFVGIGDFGDSSYNEVKKLFNSNKVHIYKGIFPQETSKYIEKERFKLVHLDVDTYTSYKESLEFFYNKMIMYGCIIFDDYNVPTCLGATKAINEFFKDKKEKIQQKNNSYFIIKE